MPSRGLSQGFVALHLRQHSHRGAHILYFIGLTALGLFNCQCTAAPMSASDVHDPRGLDYVMSLYNRGDLSARQAIASIDRRLHELQIQRSLVPTLCVAADRLQTVAEHRRVDPLPACLREVYSDVHKSVVFETLWDDRQSSEAETLWAREQALRAVFVSDVYVYEFDYKS